MLLTVGARFRVHLDVTFLSTPLEVSPVRNGFAFSRFREADPTSLPSVRKSIQRKMRFQSLSVLLEPEPRAHPATCGSAPQTDRLVEDQQCPCLAASCPDMCSLVSFSDRIAGGQSPGCAPDS